VASEAVGKHEVSRGYGWTGGSRNGCCRPVHTEITDTWNTGGVL
jgi:hypothetical protein